MEFTFTNNKSLKLCDLLINKVANLEKKTYNVKEYVQTGIGLPVSCGGDYEQSNKSNGSRYDSGNGCG